MMTVINPVVYAASTYDGQIVINELNYHPGSDLDGDEFIELHNTSASPVNLENWCFTSGFDLCFTASTIIAVNDYLVIANDLTQFQADYGFAADVEFDAGKLSNGGEFVELRDNSNETVDSVDYLDGSPWPSSPDGNGPSLELIDPTADNSLPANWGASISDDGTPGAQNSLFGLNQPIINNVSKPTDVAPSNTPTITANVTNETSVNLIYKIGFGSEQTIQMYDDGAHNDGAANDDLYGATIPAQAAGSLVRYKTEATNGVVASKPSAGDSINYLGYVVEDGSDDTIPILRWYMEPADFTDMTTNHLSDDQLFPAVVVYDGQVFDNSQVRVKGQSTVNSPKRKYKFELPSGYKLDNSSFGYPVDAFSIENSFLGNSQITDDLSWKVFGEFGFPTLQPFSVRVQKNTATEPSEFYGHYTLLDSYDKSWRERNGYDNGALYKAGTDKKTREDEDNSDIQSLYDNITTLSGDQLRQYLNGNLDIPNIINYDAISTIIRNGDWSYYRNVYQYRDTEGTQRWGYLPWDLDGSFTPVKFIDFDFGVMDPGNPMPTSGPLDAERHIEKALYQFPEYREMYKHRVVTIKDKLQKNDTLKNWHRDIHNEALTTLNDDYSAWLAVREPFITALFTGTDFDAPLPADFPINKTAVEFMATATPAESKTMYDYELVKFFDKYDSLQADGSLPLSQTIQPRITITELMYNPPDGSDHEYLELYNPNNYAVDISGWKIDGIGLTIPQGTVLPSNGYGLVVKNDVAFREHYGGGRFIISEYDGKLANEGETISLLRTDNSLASRVSYQPGTNGWPVSPNGQGYSLELIRTSANPELATCWAPSAGLNGSPGNTNSPNQAWVDQYGNDCTDFEDIESTVTLAKTGQSNQFFITVASSLVSFGAFLTIFKQSRYSHR